MKRLYYRTDLAAFNGERGASAECAEAEANLVSSLTPNERHAPVLDLDFPCQLVPSTTPGHFHLYLDKTVTWEQYRGLLDALFAAGLIEEGFHRMSLQRGATFVRKPGVMKEPGDSNSAHATQGVIA